MRHRVAEAGLAGEIVVESAGTGAWHVGDPADPRAIAEARARGVTMVGVARRFEVGDFARLDLVLAMDDQNAADLRSLAPDAAAAATVRLLREFDPAASGRGLSVPDPYFGGTDGFREVFDMVDAACRGLLADLRAGRHAAP